MKSIMTITERIDHITEMTPEWRRVDPPVPPSVKVELTARCNFACAFCARGQMLRQQKDMSQPDFERLALGLREAGVEELGLFYLGESFLLKWLPEAVRFAKEEAGFPYVFLTTNGSLATGPRVAALMDAGLDSLKFSLNWADPEQFMEVARVKPALFHKVLANVEAAYRAREAGGYSCGLYGSYIQYDGDQAERMAAYLDQVRPFLDELYAVPLYNQAGLVSEEEAEMGWRPIAGNIGRVGALRDPLPCWAVFREGHVTHDLKLSACCFDHNDSFTMGDLGKVPFMDAWHSEQFQSLRLAHMAEDVTGTPCETCVAYN